MVFPLPKIKKEDMIKAENKLPNHAKKGDLPTRGMVICPSVMPKKTMK